MSGTGSTEDQIHIAELDATHRRRKRRVRQTFATLCVLAVCAGAFHDTPFDTFFAALFGCAATLWAAALADHAKHERIERRNASGDTYWRR